MKRIVEIPDKVVEAIQNGEDYRYDIHTAIAQSTPYNPSGDCISREALKEHKVYSEERHEYVVPVYIIDNAQPIDLDKQTYKDAYDQGYADGWKERYGEPDGRLKGEWIDYSETGGYVECPFCGSATTCESNKEELHFCFNCGAQMGGGAE